MAKPPHSDSSLGGNLLRDVVASKEREVFEDLLLKEHVRIERIVSYGQSSPVYGWYDQAEHEWVMVLTGAARIAFEDGRTVALRPHDYLHIVAGEKHRVEWTTPDEPTVWLAVFYR